MALPHWRQGAWDYTWLGGKLLPGITDKISVTRSRSVQKVKEKNEDGFSLKDEGDDGATVELVQKIWTGPIIGDSQLTELEVMLGAISPKRPGAKGQPLDIMHPACMAAGVSSVYVIKYTIGKPEEGGFILVPISMTEFFPEAQIKKTQQGKATTGQLDDGGPLDEGYVPPVDPENLGPAQV